jgi:hypothetical protein
MADAIVADFGDVASKLRDKIKSAFVDLIPEERWDAMLKAEVAKFMSGTPEHRNGYGNYVAAQPSEFSKVCQSVLSEMIREEAKKRFAEVKQEDVFKAVSQWIEQNHQNVVKQFVAGLFQQGTQLVSLNLASIISMRLQDFLQQHR